MLFVEKLKQEEQKLLASLHTSEQQNAVEGTEAEVDRGVGMSCDSWESVCDSAPSPEP